MDWETLKQRMRTSGLTQDAIAAAAGIDPARLSRVLRGRLPLSANLAIRVANAIDILERAEQAASEARGKVMAELHDCQPEGDS